MIWDPRPEIFYLPILHHPVTWYGLFFALGFFLGYLYLTTWRPELKKCLDKMTLYLLIGMILGARLFHIAFYEYPLEYLKEPWRILKTWEGGLSSHGGISGILVALFLFFKRHKKEFPTFGFWELLNALALPALILAGFIRIGNFVNQEVLGTVAYLPWAVRFGHPCDGVPFVPRHPVQLYEAFFYWALFFLLHRQRDRWTSQLGSLTLMTVFIGRFCFEFLKEEQSVYRGILTMGQWLSLPIIFLAFILIFQRHAREKASDRPI